MNSLSLQPDNIGSLVTKDVWAADVVGLIEGFLRAQGGGDLHLHLEKKKKKKKRTGESSRCRDTTISRSIVVVPWNNIKCRDSLKNTGE